MLSRAEQLWIFQHHNYCTDYNVMTKISILKVTWILKSQS